MKSKRKQLYAMFGLFGLGSIITLAFAIGISGTARPPITGEALKDLILFLPYSAAFFAVAGNALIAIIQLGKPVDDA